MYLAPIPPTPCLLYLFLSHLLSYNAPLVLAGVETKMFSSFCEISFQWKFPRSSKYFHFAKIIMKITRFILFCGIFAKIIQIFQKQNFLQTASRICFSLTHISRKIGGKQIFSRKFWQKLILLRTFSRKSARISCHKIFQQKWSLYFTCCPQVLLFF